MLSLLYRIGGDVNPLRQALKQGERAAAQSGTAMGNLMGSQIKAGIMRYIGAGALLGGLTNLAREAQQIMREAGPSGMGIEELQAMTAAAERAGISIEQLRAAAASSPEAFAALMQSVRESGEVMDAASTMSLNNLAQRAIATRGILARAAAFGIDLVEMGARGAMGWMGVETTLRRTNPELLERAQIDSPAAQLRRVAEGNAHWESIGGNIDWSAQSREVESRQTRERTQELLRMQVEQQRETVSALHDLRNEMRNL